MDKIIVYVDDAAYAQQQLAPMKSRLPANVPGQPTQWIVVACAPRMTHRISKWVSHSAREKWRSEWAGKLFNALVPALEAGGDQVVTVLAKTPLTELTERLKQQHGTGRVMDARRPKLGQPLAPLTAEQARRAEGQWALPGAAVGMGAMLVLAAE